MMPGTLQAPTVSPSIFESAAIRQTIAQIARASETRDSLVVCGEPGAGRETVARAINDGFDGQTTAGDRDPSETSRRCASDSGRPFFAIDCGTPDVRALEALIFGSISPPRPNDGGALDVLGSSSRLVLATGGTMVLRNLAEMPTRLQVRLARLLRESEAQLADAAGTRVDLDVRVVALVEPEFERQIAEGRLVPELLRRMNGPRIDMPPLRRRREDLPGLVLRMIDTLAAAMHMPPKRVSVAALQLLAALPWRGNLPEMRGLLQLLLVKVPGPVIRLADVLTHVRLDGAAPPVIVSGTLKEARERFEREYVAFVIEQHKGRMAEAAKTLGIQRTNLYRKVRQLSVSRRNGRRQS